MNGSAVVEEDLDIQDPTPRIVDLQTVTITPSFLLNGVPFPISSLDRGSIVLVDSLGGQISLGTTQFPASGVLIAAGEYDAYFRSIWSTGTAPINPNAQIASGTSLVVDQTLALDVPTADIFITYTLDGAPFPTDPSERAHLTLVGETPGDSIPLGETDDPPPSQPCVSCPVCTMSNTTGVRERLCP